MRLDEADDERVMLERARRHVVKLRDEIGVLVGEAREGVQDQLEPDVARGAEHGALERDVAARHRDRVVQVGALRLGNRVEGRDVFFGRAGRRERDGFGGEHAPHLEDRREQLLPRRVVLLERLRERAERVEARALAPRRDDRPGAVPRHDEPHRLEPRERRTQRQPVDPERQRELALGRQPRPGGEPPREDLPANPLDHGVDDARPRDGREDRQRLRLFFEGAGTAGLEGFCHWVIQWFNQ